MKSPLQTNSLQNSWISFNFGKTENPSIAIQNTQYQKMCLLKFLIYALAKFSLINGILLNSNQKKASGWKIKFFG
jgi:hypothetical protein